MASAARREQITAELGRLGLSLYEARAYVALLETQPVNGYDLAKASGIPASKIYETLQRLVAKGAALASASEPTIYRAVPPESLIANYRQETEQSLSFLQDSLAHLTAEPTPGVVWRLRGGKAILHELAGIVSHAGQELYLSLWPQEAGMLAEPVANARERGVRLWIASFGPCPFAGAGIYDLSSCGESSSGRLGRRLTAAAGDGRHTLIAEFGDGTEPTGTLADDPALALATKEYIIHDLVNHALIQEIGLERFAAMRREQPLLAGLLGPQPGAGATGERR